MSASCATCGGAARHTCGGCGTPFCARACQHRDAPCAAIGAVTPLPVNAMIGAKFSTPLLRESLDPATMMVLGNFVFVLQFCDKASPCTVWEIAKRVSLRIPAKFEYMRNAERVFRGTAPTSLSKYSALGEEYGNVYALNTALTAPVNLENTERARRHFWNELAAFVDSIVYHTDGGLFYPEMFIALMNMYSVDEARENANRYIIASALKVGWYQKNRPETCDGWPTPAPPAPTPATTPLTPQK